MAPLKETYAFWFLVASNSFFAITATLGNSIILAALSKGSSLHPPSKTLFRSLALTDLCVGLLLEPLFVMFLMTIEYESWDLCYYVITITYVIGQFLTSAALLTLAAISVDRLLALLLGLRYREVVTIKRVVTVVIVFWTQSTGFALAMLFNHNVASHYGFFGILVVLVVSTCCHIKICKKLRNHQAQIREHVLQGQPSAEEPLNIARYRKTVASVLWVHLAVNVCYLPMDVVLVLTAIEGMHPSLAFSWTFSATLVHFNSTLNPILYCWKIREVRRVVLSTIREISCLSN